MLFVLFGVSLLSSDVVSMSFENGAILEAMMVLKMIHEDVERIKNEARVKFPVAECTACYAGLDCFDKCSGAFGYIGELPQSPEQISTRFTLYSRYIEQIIIDLLFRL